MLPSKLAEEVAEKIKSLPADKQQEVLKSIEAFVAESTRIVPQKHTGPAWVNAAPEHTENQRPNVWRFTAGPRPNPFDA